MNGATAPSAPKEAAAHALLLRMPRRHAPRTPIGLLICSVLACTSSTLAQSVTPSPSPTEPPWDPFCAVHVAAVPWNRTSGAPSSSLADSIVLALFSQSGSQIDAHVTLISETDAYDAALTNLALSRTSFAHSTTAIFVTLPKAAPLRYAYVDSYRLDGGPEKSCASEPFDLHSWQKSLQAPPAVPPTSPRFAAVVKGPLPPLSCGRLYTDAQVTRAFQPSGFNVNKTYTVLVGVVVDSDGRPVDTWIYKSSGLDYADALARATALQSQYAPATLLCTPIVGRYLFRVDFAP